MSEENQQATSQSNTPPFVDTFNINKKHPLFRTKAEAEELDINKEPLKHNEYPTNEQQKRMSPAQPGFSEFSFSSR